MNLGLHRYAPEMERAIRAPWFALEYLYPEALYPDVYFVIGATAGRQHMV